MPINYDRHQANAKTPSLSFVANITPRDRNTAQQTDKILGLARSRAVRRRLHVFRFAGPHDEPIAVTLDNRLDVSLLTRFR